MEKLRVAVIGTGHISRSHLNEYRDNPNVEIYALCDLNEERLKKAGEEYGVTRLFTDKDEMLKLKEIDAVSVTTWNSEHAPCTIAALNAGKHVICEKPMATSVAEAVAMKEAADKNGKLLMVGFVRRFGKDMTLLKDLQKTDTLGEIYYAKAAYMRCNGFPGGWFGDKSRSGGGPLVDLGVHIIDYCRYAMGCPKPTQAYGVTYQKLAGRENLKSKKAYIADSATGDEVFDVEDLASALVKFDNGATLAIETSFSLNASKDNGGIFLFGTKGGALVEGCNVTVTTELNDYFVNIKPDEDYGAQNYKHFFNSEINHFVDCIMNGTECISKAEDGVVLMQILESIYKSAQENKSIDIEPIV